MKGFMESFNHPFGKEACKKRLLEEYKKYGKLIVAFDYDNTILTTIIMEETIVVLLSC